MWRARSKGAVWALLGLAVLALSMQAGRGGSGAFDLFVDFSNAPVFTVTGLPVFDEDLPDLSLSFTDSEIYVDGAGKIQGFALASVSTSELDSTLVLNLSGSLGTQGVKPILRLRLSGTGSTSDGTSSGRAKLTLDFTGSLQQLSEDDGGGFVLTGKFAGQFRPGLKGTKPVAIKDAAGTLEDFVAMPDISLDTQVMLSDQEMSLAGWVRTPSFTADLPLLGTGRLQSNTNLTMEVRGTARAAGSKFRIQGAASENPFTSDITAGAVTSFSVTGKILGQKVKSDKFSIGITPAG